MVLLSCISIIEESWCLIMDETTSILYTTLIGGLALAAVLFALYKTHLLTPPGSEGDSSYSRTWGKFTDKAHDENPTY